MKKIIAIALLLAMCLCMFAGCNNTPAETVDAQAAVQKAADYVKSMYLEDSGEVTIDFTLVKAVSTNNGSYTVTWTVDNTEMVKIIDGTNSVTIDIENYPAEAYNFKLTATVADANGNTASIVLKYSVPKAAGTTASLENGTYVMAIDGKSFAALAETLNYGAVYPNDVVIEGGAATSFITTDVITVTNVEGGVTLQDCYGRYIYLKGDYNTFNVSKEAPAEGHVWNVLSSDAGYILVNVLNGKTIAFDTGKGSYGANLELTEAHKTALTVVAVNADDAAQPGAEYGVENKDKLVSIETAIDIATNIGPAGSTYKVYITGTVTEIASDVYGNMYITDGTNTLYVYGVYDADGTNRYDAMANAPKVGDEITLYGILSTHNGSPQMKNGWVRDEVGGGETEKPSTPSEPSTPADPADAPFANGDKIVIVNVANNKALSSEPCQAGSYYQLGRDVTVSGDTVTGYTDADVWTVIVNEDGTYSFSYNGKNLGMQDSYASMSLGAVNDKWELIVLENGTYALKNVVRGNCIEWFASKNNWSTYTSNNLEGDPLFQLAFFVVG